MAYLVSLSDRAERDLAALYEEKNAAGSSAAARWFNGLEAAVLTLEQFPRRCPAAPEGLRTKRALRHLLYGKKPHVYRVIYEVDERQKIVQVITIRHGAMEPATLP
jgi:plasmid stabilization system protein ParE